MTRRFIRALVVGVAGSLLAALGLLAVVWVQRELIGMQSWRWWSRDQVWMIPLGYLLVFAPVTLLLALLHLLVPRRVSFATVGAVMLALSAFATLLVFGRIAPIAWALVAVGIGIRSWQWLARADDGGWRAWRAVASTAALGFAAAAAWKIVGEQRSEAKALASLPPSAADAPNVLLIILDTVREEAFRLSGGDSATAPALGKRAREGVVFDSAYSTAPWTLPSHASIFTGRYPSQQTGDWRSPMDEVPRTIAEVFRDNGYATGGFTANLLATGYSTGLARGFVRYMALERTVEEAMFSTTLTQSGSFWRAWRAWQDERWLGRAMRHLAEFDLRPNGNYQVHERKRASVVADDFLEWQAGLGERRFFAFLNLFDAHAPYEPPAPNDTMYAPRGKAYGLYQGGIRSMDDVMERMLSELESRGVLRNTIVVVTSDHGELFGEHGLRGHGNSLYRPVLHVPLVILAPDRLPKGVRVGRNVSLRDLAATILDIAGLSRAGDGIGGVSLREVIEGASDAPASPILAEVSRGINEKTDVPTANADLKTILSDSVQVIESSAGTVQAFRYRQDPHDSVDVANDPAQRSALLAWVERLFGEQQLVWSPRRAPQRPGGGSIAR